MLNGVELRWSLEDLCVRQGFCLTPAGNRRIMESPPTDVDSFVEAIYREEGLDPQTSDRKLYRRVREVVADAFRRAGYDDE